MPEIPPLLSVERLPTRISHIPPFPSVRPQDYVLPRHAFNAEINHRAGSRGYFSEGMVEVGKQEDTV